MISFSAFVQFILVIINVCLIRSFFISLFHAVQRTFLFWIPFFSFWLEFRLWCHFLKSRMIKRSKWFNENQKICWNFVGHFGNRIVCFFFIFYKWNRLNCLWGGLSCLRGWCGAWNAISRLHDHYKTFYVLTNILPSKLKAFCHLNASEMDFGSYLRNGIIVTNNRHSSRLCSRPLNGVHDGGQ